MKVKPKKITKRIFCPYCNDYTDFRVDHEGVASLTPKGVIIYKEFYGICKKCENEVYVPALNDLNVYRREKAFKEKSTPVGNEISKLVKDIGTIDWVPCTECIYSDECGYKANCDGCGAGVREEEDYETI